MSISCFYFLVKKLSQLIEIIFNQTDHRSWILNDISTIFIQIVSSTAFTIPLYVRLVYAGPPTSLKGHQYKCPQVERLWFYSYGPILLFCN